MAYYYYYQQQHHTQSGSLSPGTMASELTPSLPPLLLLSPQQQQQQQQQLNLPLVTPVIPSVTTSLPMTTNTTTIEFNQQQQLSTPKLSPFLRHCEETGLFQDLRNIGAISSLTGPPNDTTTTSVPITSTSTMVTTTSTELSNNSNFFGLSSSAILTHINPFDETFKQAVLQQKRDSKLAENLFSDNNNTDGDLNTPFISTTTIVNTSNNHNDSTLTMAALPVDIITTAVVAAPITVESMTTNTSTVPQPQQQNLFMTTSATESPGSVLVMMMEQQQQQQQHNSIISIQPQHQQHHLTDDQHQQFIVPTTSNITSDIDTTTITFHDQDYNSNSEGGKGKKDKTIHIENETTTIKQTLKQNLLVKRQMQEQQKCSLVLETHHNPGQIHLHDLDIDIITTGAVVQDKGNSDHHGQEKNNNQKQLQQKHKQELLERNRFAAKRCRMKRKQRWELLSEENRRLKVENNRLRDILTKLINRGYGGKQQITSLQVQQSRE